MNLYTDGERDFIGVKLIPGGGEFPDDPIDLRGLKLCDINLRGSDLRLADLTETNLTRADLSNVFLSQACLKRTVMQNANLRSANLRWCNLSEADLRRSVLDHINATCAYSDDAKLDAFDYAILADTSFLGARIAESTICRGGNLIWRTVMPDGTIKTVPQYGDGR